MKSKIIILRTIFGSILPALTLSIAGVAQQPLPFQNPSFEDRPDFGRPPAGWFFCGNFGETPPDIHPGGFYGVETQPKDGRTYVGMVTRDNGTAEQLGQRLVQPLVPGKCYAFRVFAARSEVYSSFSRITGQPAPFTLPLKLAVLGAHRHCEPTVVLALSKTILETEWQQLDFVLRPEEAFDHLILAASSANGERYNGNILMDAASPLVPCDCEAGMPVLERFDLPRPDGSDRWKDWLAALNSDLEDGVLTQHLFETADGVVHYQNKYLLGLVRFMQYSDRVKLRIAFNPNHCPAQFEEKLQQEIERCGLSKKRYTFKESKIDSGCAIIAR